jgi:A/G-specific adenine glycosylase
MPNQKHEIFVLSLLEWAKDNLRKYPWRVTKDPYKIMIAEIMLQRTKADQVVEIYENFIKQYPNPQAIENASLKDIAACIRSLGLAKRARGLKMLGQQLVDEYAGRIPKDRKKLLALFGVGNYVADAVRCHAYGVDVLTVDANLARVLKRVFSIQTKTIPQKDRSVRLFSKEIAVCAGNRCRRLNLAIIDLSSLICTPRNPRCRKCPLNSICDYGRVCVLQA